MRKFNTFSYYFSFMPKISHNSLIDLTAFRQANGLLQQDVAEYLGVSRGYVSMVEKGASKLSHSNLDKLFEAKASKQWDLSDLVPAYTRYISLSNYLNIERNKRREAEGLFPAYFVGVDEDTEAKIRYGEIGLSEKADFIKMWCEQAPEINIEWVTSGKGSMLKSIEPHEEPTKIDILLQEIRDLKATMDDLKQLIISYKSE